MDDKQPTDDLDDYTVIRLFGDYDIARAAELEAQLLAPPYASMLELDMRDVSYVDSTALTCLIRLQKRLGEHGLVRLVGMPPNVRRIFTITKLDSVFDIVE